MTAPVLTSRRPYLLRALHEWISDNGQTPHIVVDAAVPGVSVPEQYVKDGRIILNISLSAAQGLVLGNESLTFRARFGGASHDIVVPLPAVVGIYARESGQGMIFGDVDGPPGAPEPTPPRSPEPGPSGPKAVRKPQLKVVK